MAHLPPEDVATMPAQKIVFNAPFDNNASYYVRIINTGTKRIIFKLNTTKPKRITMNPSNGLIGPKKSVTIRISCDAMIITERQMERCANDHITVRWRNAPDSAEDATYKPEWFHVDGMQRRKKIAIQYNI
uniref:Major sperm protein n=1 Tax=Globodera rostochiensis TaxID=31243 RepID=A0A914HXI6_GLORO